MFWSMLVMHYCFAALCDRLHAVLFCLWGFHTLQTPELRMFIICYHFSSAIAAWDKLDVAVSLGWLVGL